MSHSSTVLPFVHPDDMLPQIESLPRFALYSMDDLAHAIHTKDLQGSYSYITIIVIGHSD